MAATVWTAHTSLKVRDTDTPPGGATTTVSLYAAKNEFASFQICVYDTASAIDVSLGSGLAGLNLTYYREDLINITTATALGATGNWPDALLPKVDPYYSETRTVFPFNGTAGKTRVIFVDIQIPSGTAAGAITGVINLSIGGVNTAINVTVNVWNFAIPSTSTLKSAFDLVWNAQDNAAPDIKGDLTKMIALRALYVQCALDNRISIDNPDGGQATNPSSNFATHYDPVSAGPFLSGTASTRLVGAKLTAVQLEGSLAAANVTTWNNHFVSKGWNQLYTYCKPDEPKSVSGNTTAGSANITVSSAIFSHGDTVIVEQAGPSGANLTTTVSSVSGSPAVNLVLATACSTTVPFATVVKSGSPNGDWPNVISSVNGVQAGAASVPRLVTKDISTAQIEGCNNISLFCPVIDQMYNKPGKHNAGNQRSKYTGNVWWYQSCDSYGCAPGSGEGGWPSYAIDHSAIRNRAMEWMSFWNNMQGELYYETAQQFAANPYTSQFYSGGNGDGNLFYWGRPTDIGGTHHIPIESLRMKQIRNGMQDYELLTLAAANGHSADAVNLALSLFPNTYSTSATPADIDSARSQLATWILATPGGGGGGGTLVMTSAATPGGASSGTRIRQLTKLNTGDVLLDRVQSNIIGVLNPVLRSLPTNANFQLVEQPGVSGAAPTYTLQVRGSSGWTTLDTFDSTGALTVSGLKLTGALSPSTDAKKAQAGALYMGSGVPANANGNNGDFYFRTDTPGTANQRLYVRSAGAWVGIV